MPEYKVVLIPFAGREIAHREERKFVNLGEALQAGRELYRSLAPGQSHRVSNPECARPSRSRVAVLMPRAATADVIGMSVNAFFHKPMRPSECAVAVQRLIGPAQEPCVCTPSCFLAPRRNALITMTVAQCIVIYRLNRPIDSVVTAER